MKTAFRALITIALLASSQMSCNVNDYCLNCGTGDGGGSNRDGGDDDAGSNLDDGGSDGGCVVTGPEECDGKDNDCDGFIDNGTLPMVGTDCANQMGACAGGKLQCVNGALKCDKQPQPETCNAVDDNCNGVADEGDPGGGAKCGTDMGECVAGTFRCNAATGVLDCIGFQDHRMDAELCDGKDNDCDGSFDEGLTNLGSCGPATNVGACEFGQLSCSGGAPFCGSGPNGPPVFPKFETCNNADDDCDMAIDEVFNKQIDTQNCGTCGTVCPSHANANTRCIAGSCGFQCKPGFVDLDPLVDGCEYPCFPSGVETCDGIDNDCNGIKDDNLTPPSICRSGGECGATAPTAQCMGAAGWSCTYPGDVQFPETKCDGLNNDCDANTDEGQPNKNLACNDGRQGACRGTGTYICDANNLDGPAICDITSPGQTNPDPAETCDDRDNDCDGAVDEGAETGSLIGQEWVSIGGGREIMKYEASRFDSSPMQQGTGAAFVAAAIAASPNGATHAGNVATITTVSPHGLAVGSRIRITGVATNGYNGVFTVATIVNTTRFTVSLVSATLPASGGGSVSRYKGSCSKAGVMPWTNVTYPEALAVCESMGATLCTETRWHQACSAIAPTTYPVTINAANGTLIEAEDYYGIAPGTTQAWAEDYTPAPESNSGMSNMRALPNTGTSITTGNAVAQSPRLDFQFNFPTAANDWRIYVRMYSAITADRNVHIGLGTTLSPPTTPAITLAPGANGTWQWVRSAAINIPATGNRFVSLYMGQDGVKVDAIFIVRGTTVTPPAALNGAGGTWSYSSNATSYQAMTCNGADRSAANDDVLTTGALASCFAAHAAGGVFDLSGNVREWALARTPGQNPIRGGSSSDLATGISCPLNFSLASDTFFFPNVGFRCCR